MLPRTAKRIHQVQRAMGPRQLLEWFRPWSRRCSRFRGYFFGGAIGLAFSLSFSFPLFRSVCGDRGVCCLLLLFRGGCVVVVSVRSLRCRSTTLFIILATSFDRPIAITTLSNWFQILFHVTLRHKRGIITRGRRNPRIGCLEGCPFPLGRRSASRVRWL